MSDPFLKAGLDHPCKETCSGWEQGFERGVESVSEENVILRVLMLRMATGLRMIVKKNPNRVSREEAADMACEFHLAACEALSDFRIQHMIEERELMEAVIELIGDDHSKLFDAIRALEAHQKERA